MTKFFQLVAVVLIGAVLGGTQCVEICSFLSVDCQTKTTEAPEREMPCHHKHSPKESQPPSNDKRCSHQELVAENLSKASSADDLQVVSLVAARIEAQLAPAFSSSPLSQTQQLFPRLSSLALTSILRI